MSEPIIYVDQSEIREGKLEALKEGMDELADLWKPTSLSCSPTTCTSTRSGPG